MLDPELLRAALPHAFRKLDPRLLARNPVMFVVEITAVLVTPIAVVPRPRHPRARGRDEPRVRPPDRDLALVHGPVRDLRRGRRRGPRPRPGGDAPQDPLGDDRPPPRPRRDARGRGLVGAPQRRHRRRPRGRDDPVRRRRHRGRRLRQRGGDHRRVGAGPQGARHRHPLGVTGGTTVVSRLARHPRHGQPRRDVPRPDDRARRGRKAPADAERDRALDPALRPDARVPAGDGDAPAVRRVRRGDRAASSRSSRCSSASSRRRSAACCPRSASPAWTASPGSTSSR